MHYLEGLPSVIIYIVFASIHSFVFFFKCNNLSIKQESAQLKRSVPYLTPVLLSVDLRIDIYIRDTSIDEDWVIHRDVIRTMWFTLEFWNMDIAMTLFSFFINFLKIGTTMKRNLKITSFKLFLSIYQHCLLYQLEKSSNDNKT